MQNENGKEGQENAGMTGFVIPAIDIMDGKCVRLVQGDFSKKKVYNENPLDVARRFEDAGLRRLHLVDLDGAKAGKVRNWKVLEEIAAHTRLIIDFGGGVNSGKDVGIALDAGAAMVAIGSVAVKDEILFSSWIRQYGAKAFLVGADVRDGKIAVRGWQETADIGIYDFISRYREKQVNRFFCTDVNMDGLMAGPSLDLYRGLLEKFPDLRLIASGGVRSMDDILQLRTLGCEGVIVGKAIYEGRVSLADLIKI